jgi:hypothetical protein
MADLLRQTPLKSARAVYDLTIQLDKQLYPRLYGLQPLTFEGRQRLLAFCFSTCWAACRREIGAPSVQVRLKALDLCHDYMLHRRQQFFAKMPGAEAARISFSEHCDLYDRAWLEADGDLRGGRGYAAIRQCLAEILFGEEDVGAEDPKVMQVVLELSEVLERIRAAF